MEEYEIVLETNCYAGNYEREMCAFMTGQIGDCSVGNEIAKEFKKEFPEMYEKFEENIRQEYDGCYRPVSANSKSKEGLTIYFFNTPTNKELEFMKRRASEFKYNTWDGNRGSEYGEPEGKQVDLKVHSITLCKIETTIKRSELWTEIL